MICIFEQFEPRYWRDHVICHLDIWSMLILIQTNKYINKNKLYIYRIIYQTICFNDNYKEIEQPLNLVHEWYNEKHHFVYNKKMMQMLVKNNTYIRNLIISYIESHNKQSDRIKNSFGYIKRSLLNIYI